MKNRWLVQKPTRHQPETNNQPETNQEPTRHQTPTRHQQETSQKPNRKQTPETNQTPTRHQPETNQKPDTRHQPETNQKPDTRNQPDTNQTPTTVRCQGKCHNMRETVSRTWCDMHLIRKKRKKGKKSFSLNHSELLKKHQRTWKLSVRVKKLYLLFLQKKSCAASYTTILYFRYKPNKPRGCSIW